MFPPSTNLVFGKPEVVGGRVDWLSPLNSHHHHLADGIFHSALFVERNHFLVKRSGVENRCDTLEPVTLTQQRVDDVYLEVCVSSKVREGHRRSNVGEDKVLVVPHRGGALGREIRRTVRADGCDEPRRCSSTTRFMSVVRSPMDSLVLVRRPT